MDAIKAAEAIRKYKELLDMGAITAEEFEERKRQFLSSTGENGGGSKPSPNWDMPPPSSFTACGRCFFGLEMRKMRCREYRSGKML